MDVTKIILHIGRHKSGTSSLQHFLAHNAMHLGETGTLYPKAGRMTALAHHELFFLCNDGNGPVSALDRIRDSLMAEAQGYRTILLSSEGFQNLRRPDRLRYLLAAFPHAHIQIICYVREHVDYAISSFRQFVQNRDDFSTFRDKANSMPNLDNFLRLWRGLGDLTLRWFERDAFDGGDVIADFCKVAGLHLPVDPFARSAGVRDMNPSLGGNLLFFKLVASHAGMPFAASYSGLRQLAWDHAQFRTAFHVADATAQAIRQTSAYNAVLFRELGEPVLKSWEAAPALPDLATLERDISIVAAAYPALAPVLDAARRLAVQDGARHWF